MKTKTLWETLIRKKIVAFRSHKSSKELRYILFDDKQSYIELEEQDSYYYHDCDQDARRMILHKSKNMWATLYSDKNGYFVEAKDFDFLA